MAASVRSTPVAGPGIERVHLDRVEIDQPEQKAQGVAELPPTVTAGLFRIGPGGFLRLEHVIFGLFQALSLKKVEREGRHLAGHMAHVTYPSIGDQVRSPGGEVLEVPAIRDNDFSAHQGGKFDKRTGIARTSRHRFVDQHVTACFKAGLCMFRNAACAVR